MTETKNKPGFKPYMKLGMYRPPRMDRLPRAIREALEGIALCQLLAEQERIARHPDLKEDRDQ